MTPVQIGKLTWLAPNDTQVGDWALLPSTVFPAQWAQVTSLDTTYDGKLRSVLAIQCTTPTAEQREELQKELRSER